MPTTDEVNAAFDSLNKTVHRVVSQMVPQFVPGFMQGQATQEIGAYLASNAGRTLIVNGTRDALVAAEGVRAKAPTTKAKKK